MSSDHPAKPATRRAALLAGAVFVVGAAFTADISAAQTADSGFVEVNFGFPWNGGVGSVPRLTDPTGYAIHLGLAAPILEGHGFSLGRQIGFNTGPLALAGLQSGEIQLAQTGETPAVLTAVNNQGTRAVTVGAPAGDLWLVARTAEISDLGDLAGQSVGAAYGSNFDKFALAALSGAGLIEQVEVVNVSPSETYAALQNGSVAAVVAGPPQAAGWLRRDDTIHVIRRARDGDPRIELSSSVFVTTGDFAEANPGIQDALWAVQQAGIARILAEPADYYAFFAEVTGLTPEEAEGVVLLNYADAPISPDGLGVIESSLTFLTNRGIIERGVDLEAWVLP